MLITFFIIAITLMFYVHAVVQPLSVVNVFVSFSSSKFHLLYVI